jgi:chorismate lyase / 3-hydroxybenzoate synthase
LQPSDLIDDPVRSGPAGAQPAGGRPAQLRVEYCLGDAPGPAVRDLLAVVRFDARADAPIAHSPLTVDVRLAPVHAPSIVELWHASGRVHTGREGALRFAHDDDFLFAAMEVDERIHGGIRDAAQAAYSALRDFHTRSRFPHLLRMWNYLDAINDGSDDLERYRQFCLGRARGLGSCAGGVYPAATAIGRQQTTHQLQVFWLAGRHSGTPVENPRQVSAYRYPRVHGPASPSFSRATIAGDGTLLISGTASIVGHLSRHHGDALEQLEETLRNLGALSRNAQRHNATRVTGPLKIYIREPALVPPLASRLRQLYPQGEVIFLAADICRRELLLEIECICPA